jgi:hypothetical protein
VHVSRQTQIQAEAAICPTDNGKQQQPMIENLTAMLVSFL